MLNIIVVCNMVAPQFSFTGKQDNVAEMPRGRIVMSAELCIKLVT